jgi:hypothetical protein
VHAGLVFVGLPFWPALPLQKLTRPQQAPTKRPHKARQKKLSKMRSAPIDSSTPREERRRLY